MSLFDEWNRCVTPERLAEFFKEMVIGSDIEVVAVQDYDIPHDLVFIGKDLHREDGKIVIEVASNTLDAEMCFTLEEMRNMEKAFLIEIEISTSDNGTTIH